jgi:hypothetical protein
MTLGDKLLLQNVGELAPFSLVDGGFPACSQSFPRERSPVGGALDPILSAGPSAICHCATQPFKARFSLNTVPKLVIPPNSHNVVFIVTAQDVEAGLAD